MEQSIIEGNKLIAEFMGIMVFKNYEEMKAVPIEKLSKWIYEDANDSYNADWNMLMPVLIKISEYHYPNYYSGKREESYHDYDDCAYPRTFGMRGKDGNYMVRLNANTLFIAPTLIEAAWLAIVDFITWYINTQKK